MTATVIPTTGRIRRTAVVATTAGLARRAAGRAATGLAIRTTTVGIGAWRPTRLAAHVSVRETGGMLLIAATGVVGAADRRIVGAARVAGLVAAANRTVRSAAEICVLRAAHRVGSVRTAAERLHDRIAGTGDVAGAVRVCARSFWQVE